jgi:acetyl esterase/lipase
MYRLTSWGSAYASPAQETDIADFAAVLKAKASIFKVNANKVRLFGHSAGGHLAALRGTQSNYGCVATVAAPLDLVGDFTTGTMNTALNYYVVPPATRASVSPSAQSTSASSTKFLVHFGNIDGLVPPSQAATFQAAFGSGRVQTVAYNESHMFTTAGMNAVASATSAFFQGSSCQ